MNKKGKMGTGAVLSVILVILLVIGGGLLYFSAGDEAKTPTGDSTETTPTGQDCNTAPSLNLPVRDYFQQATDVTAGVKYRIGETYFGSTKPDYASGQNVQVLLNASGYIDTTAETDELGCGSNTKQVLMKPFSEPTVEIKEDSTVLTDDANASSGTGSTISAGSSENYKVILQGTNDKTTGKMTYIVEVGSDSDVENVELFNPEGNTVSKVDIPEIYGENLSDPQTVAFELPAIDNAKEEEYQLSITADDGSTVSGSVYTTFYSGEAYVKDDGSFVDYGVEDENGNDVSEATFDYDINLS